MVGSKIPALALGLCIAVCLIATTSACSEAHHHSTTDARHLESTAATYVCPICHMHVNSSFPSVQAKDKTPDQKIFFCSEAHAQEFLTADHWGEAEAVPASDIGHTVTDPVCGMSKTVDEEAAHLQGGNQFMYFCGAGCAAKAKAHAGEYLASGSVDTSLKCPVCGMKVTSQSPSVGTAQGDQKYYFCSEKHADAFFASPSEFLGDDDLAVPARDLNKDVVDPVCGMHVHVADGSHNLQAKEDQRMYFCSGSCEQKMKASPSKYLKQADLPHTCPVCGMDVDASSPSLLFKGNYKDHMEQFEADPKDFIASHSDMGSGVMQMYFVGGYDVTILFKDLHVTSWGMLGLAMVVCFLFSFFHEGLVCYRQNLTAAYKGIQARAPERASLLRTTEVFSTHMFNRTHLVRTFLYMVSVTIAYLIMLIIMTFNVGICLASILGLVVGYWFFGEKRDQAGEAETSDVCCAAH